MVPLRPLLIRLPNQELPSTHGKSLQLWPALSSIIKPIQYVPTVRPVSPQIILSSIFGTRSLQVLPHLAQTRPRVFLPESSLSLSNHFGNSAFILASGSQVVSSSPSQSQTTWIILIFFLPSGLVFLPMIRTGRPSTVRFSLKSDGGSETTLS